MEKIQYIRPAQRIEYSESHLFLPQHDKWAVHTYIHVYIVHRFILLLFCHFPLIFLTPVSNFSSSSFCLIRICNKDTVEMNFESFKTFPLSLLYYTCILTSTMYIVHMKNFTLNKFLFFPLLFCFLGSFGWPSGLYSPLYTVHCTLYIIRKASYDVIRFHSCDDVNGFWAIFGKFLIYMYTHNKVCDKCVKTKLYKTMNLHQLF